MENYTVTIGRQFGSGGRDIGQRLSRLLGIDYYDRELIHELSKTSGLSPEFFEQTDEQKPSRLSHALTMVFGMENALTSESAVKVQSDVIERIAREKSSVIVGRCADYILRDNPRCINIFVYAPMEFRIERVVKADGLTGEEALERIRKTDKVRSSYYNYYTNKTWGAASSYHLCVDSSVLDVDCTADLIGDFVRMRLGIK